MKNKEQIRVDGRSSKGKQLLLSFSGIDGAGKSTQISRLVEALRLAGFQANVITFWDDVVTLKYFREEMGHKVFNGDRGIGSPDAPIRRRDKNIRSPLLTLIRMMLYTLDTFALRLALDRSRRKHQADSAHVIIFDRYIYDELANLSLDGKLIRAYIQALLRIVPKPNQAFVLDADPKAAFDRKPEYPIEFLCSNRDAYIELSKLAGMTVITASSIEQAHADILRLVQETKVLLLPVSTQSQVVDRGAGAHA